MGASQRWRPGKREPWKEGDGRTGAKEGPAGPRYAPVRPLGGVCVGPGSGPGPDRAVSCRPGRPDCLPWNGHAGPVRSAGPRGRRGAPGPAAPPTPLRLGLPPAEGLGCRERAGPNALPGPGGRGLRAPGRPSEPEAEAGAGGGGGEGGARRAQGSPQHLGRGEHPAPRSSERERGPRGPPWPCSPEKARVSLP